jgi:hypothetical protein
MNAAQSGGFKAPFAPFSIAVCALLRVHLQSGIMSGKWRGFILAERAASAEITIALSTSNSLLRAE